MLDVVGLGVVGLDLDGLAVVGLDVVRLDVVGLGVVVLYVPTKSAVWVTSELTHHTQHVECCISDEWALFVRFASVWAASSSLSGQKIKVWINESTQQSQQQTNL